MFVTQQRYVTIPSGLKTHFLAEDPRSQFIFFTEMHKSNACSVQTFDQSNDIRLCLVLHRDHADEHLMALHLKAAVHIANVLLFVVLGEKQ